MAASLFSFALAVSRVAIELGCSALVHSVAPLFLCVSASSVLPGGGGGGNAGVVASVALVWASQDKEKVSVPSLVSCQAPAAWNQSVQIFTQEVGDVLLSCLETEAESRHRSEPRQAE